MGTARTVVVGILEQVKDEVVGIGAVAVVGGIKESGGVGLHAVGACRLHAVPETFSISAFY